MLINFNVEKLDKLLYDFHLITGLTISVWNAQFQQLSFQPKEMRSFCRAIKESPEGRKRCFISDKKLCMECGRTGKPAIHHCHAGLIDSAIPIKFKDTIMGYMMFGQITDNHNTNVEASLKQLSKELDIDYSSLLKMYHDFEKYDEEKVNSAANILKMATRSLWLSEYIEIGYNNMASQIDDYIRSNIDTDLSIKTLCNTFRLSKNRLYEISHENFKMPIGEYIALARIDEAKRLLCTTDLPISQISTLVGIKNYNYFTKFFKGHTGTLPIKYRKRFPFNLHEN